MEKTLRSTVKQATKTNGSIRNEVDVPGVTIEAVRKGDLVQVEVVDEMDNNLDLILNHLNRLDEVTWIEGYEERPGKLTEVHNKVVYKCVCELNLDKL